MAEEANRWEGVYQSKEESQTSWHEDRPQVSLDLIAATGVGVDAAIVDVGAGSSRLVDCLLEQGFRVTALDLSDTALAKARGRLPQDAPVEWVVGNVLNWKPPGRFDIWHDRAAFHFLTEAADQARICGSWTVPFDQVATPSSEHSHLTVRQHAAVCRSHAMTRPCCPNGWATVIGWSNR